jgi:hypothetical protein
MSYGDPQLLLKQANRKRCINSVNPPSLNFTILAVH